MKTKILLLTFALACILSSCNEPNMSMRDYKKLPEYIEHCMTLSDNEIISYLQDKGYSLAWDNNEGSPDAPDRYLAFFPSNVFKKFNQKGEELAESYYDSGDFYVGVFFETGSTFISGNIAFKGDFDQEMTLYKAYTEWAYKNLPEFSTYDWSADLAGNYYVEGSRHEETYGYGGFKDYMKALDDAQQDKNFHTHNDAIGPNNKSIGVLRADYEIIFQSEECYYSRILWGERK